MVLTAKRVVRLRTQLLPPPMPTPTELRTVPLKMATTTSMAMTKLMRTEKLIVNYNIFDVGFLLLKQSSCL